MSDKRQPLSLGFETPMRPCFAICKLVRGCEDLREAGGGNTECVTLRGSLSCWKGSRSPETWGNSPKVPESQIPHLSRATDGTCLRASLSSPGESIDLLEARAGSLCGVQSQACVWVRGGGGSVAQSRGLLLHFPGGQAHDDSDLTPLPRGERSPLCSQR